MKAQDKAFQSIVKRHYTSHHRDLPWRHHSVGSPIDPYHVLVSEFMLQQTQVARVIPKFDKFIKAMPTLQSLANAKLSTVLQLWSGLGYNRRAKYLWQAVREIQNNYHGRVPNDRKTLIALPGIGESTAGAILVYAYNQPGVFIETNIRTAYIFHYFPGEQGITDRQILELLTRTIDTKNPREWYWSLMDYGTYLKSIVGNVAKKSHHYRKQAKFSGSNRQLRGAVMRLLTMHSLTSKVLKKQLPDARLDQVLVDLCQEGLIEFKAPYYQLY